LKFQSRRLLRRLSSPRSKRKSRLKPSASTSPRELSAGQYRKSGMPRTRSASTGASGRPAPRRLASPSWGATACPGASRSRLQSPFYFRRERLLRWCAGTLVRPEAAVRAVRPCRCRCVTELARACPLRRSGRAWLSQRRLENLIYPNAAEFEWRHIFQKSNLHEGERHVATIYYRDCYRCCAQHFV
jgi:hypothetical protein